jgi:hypothetical protein
MTDFSLVEATTDVHRFCEARGWQFCFIGGLAVQRSGEQRATRDADLTLLVGWGNEEPFVDELLAHFVALTESAREHALRHRVLLLRHRNGTPLDIGLGGLPFDQIERRVRLPNMWRRRSYRAQGVRGTPPGLGRCRIGGRTTRHKIEDRIS